jgi:hypothetical protein
MTSVTPKPAAVLKGHGFSHAEMKAVDAAFR